MEDVKVFPKDWLDGPKRVQDNFPNIRKAHAEKGMPVVAWNAEKQKNMHLYIDDTWAEISVMFPIKEKLPTVYEILGIENPVSE